MDRHQPATSRPAQGADVTGVSRSSVSALPSARCSSRTTTAYRSMPARRQLTHLVRTVPNHSTDLNQAVLESLAQLALQTLSASATSGPPLPSRCLQRIDSSVFDIAYGYGQAVQLFPSSGGASHASPLEEMVDLEWLEGNSQRLPTLHSRAGGLAPMSCEGRGASPVGEPACRSAPAR